MIRKSRVVLNLPRFYRQVKPTKVPYTPESYQLVTEGGRNVCNQRSTDRREVSGEYRLAAGRH